MAGALHNPAVKSQLTVYAFTTFAFTAVESSFSWLTLLRFKNVIHQTAEQMWAAYGLLPLPRLPLEIQRMLPAGCNWSSYSQLALSKVNPQLTQLLLDKAASGINTRIFMIIGLTILVVQMAVMRGAAAKVGERNLIVAGTTILTITLFGIAFAHSLLVIEILSAFIALGNGILNPSLSSLISQAASKTNRGTISGAQQGIGSLARIIAPPINNTLVGVDTSIPFVISGVLMGTAISLALRLKQPVKSEDAPESVATGH
jgi:hypothetical protein